MFDLIVFIFAVIGAWVCISIPAGVLIGRMFARNNASWHTPPMWHELVEHNDSISHEERITLVSYLRQCPVVGYVSANTWVVDGDGEVIHG